MYKIEFSDGTMLENLRLNGNNFVSDIGLTAEFFTGKLNGVKITTDDPENEYSDLIGYHKRMRLATLKHYVGREIEDGYYFVLQDITPEEYEYAQLKADVAYTVMMLDGDLE